MSWITKGVEDAWAIQKDIMRKAVEDEEQGNLMASRCFAVIQVLTQLCLPWMLEQPSSSIMEEHPLFRRLAKTHTIYK
ncbi:Uncharacterized protein SCF082_LOCUS35032, partial [Durusdinium trenchii]